MGRLMRGGRKDKSKEHEYTGPSGMSGISVYLGTHVHVHAYMNTRTYLYTHTYMHTLFAYPPADIYVFLLTHVENKKTHMH